MTDYRRPSRIVLQEPDFPYLLGEENSDATSYISVRNADVFAEDGTLFYLVGAELATYSEATGSSHVIEVMHPDATDDEGSRCRVGHFKFDSMQMKNMYGSTVIFTAWMTQAKFYPDNYTDDNYQPFNPFQGFVKPENEDETDEYPYHPPVVSFGSLPLKVEVSVRFNEKDVLKHLREVMERHAADKAARKAKAEAAAREAEQKRIRDNELRAAWLASDEGKEHAIIMKFIQHMKHAGSNLTELTDEQETLIISAAEAYFEALSKKDRAVIKKELKRRNWPVPKARVGQLLFLNVVTEKLSA